jgi:hypothetical protein
LSDQPELPAFLRRTNQEGKTMTTPTPAKKPKQKRTDALISRITVTIPLSADLPESYSEAVKAVAEIKDMMPEGATVKIESSLGKV